MCAQQGSVTDAGDVGDRVEEVHRFCHVPASSTALGDILREHCEQPTPSESPMGPFWSMSPGDIGRGRGEFLMPRRAGTLPHASVG